MRLGRNSIIIKSTLKNRKGKILLTKVIKGNLENLSLSYVSEMKEYVGALVRFNTKVTSLKNDRNTIEFSFSGLYRDRDIEDVRLDIVKSIIYHAEKVGWTI